MNKTFNPLPRTGEIDAQSSYKSHYVGCRWGILNAHVSGARKKLDMDLSL